MDLLAKHGITYDDADHRYERFGQRVTSVTGVLPYIENEWLQNNQQVKEKAGERGHRVARFIEKVECEPEAYDSDPAFFVPPDEYLRDSLEVAYLNFKRETGFKALVSPTGDISAELFVYHDLMNYVGRLDIAGICYNLNRDVTIIDTKGTHLNPAKDANVKVTNVGMQTAAYLEAYNRCAKDYGLPKAKKRACLHLNPKLYKSGWKLEPLENPRDFGNFMSLLNSHRIAKEMGCALTFVPLTNEANEVRAVAPAEVFA